MGCAPNARVQRAEDDVLKFALYPSRSRCNEYKGVPLHRITASSAKIDVLSMQSKPSEGELPWLRLLLSVWIFQRK
jgi:hypothetical protein